MKPTKMRNSQLYWATNNTKSKQLSCPLSKELRSKYGKRSVRVVKGDTVKVVRGVYKDTTGKISKSMSSSTSIAIEGIKKEKGKGDKIDILIHTSNIVVTSLHSDDRWRMARLEGKDPKSDVAERKRIAREEQKENKAKKETADSNAKKQKDTSTTKDDTKKQKDTSTIKDDTKKQKDTSTTSTTKDDTKKQKDTSTTINDNTTQKDKDTTITTINDKNKKEENDKE
jgi:large subunit ribosomal protein L24